MIAFVRGTVAELSLTSAVVEVGGVGLELNCTPNTLASLRTGAQATLPTSMIVREDSMTLFGFLDDDEKSLFEMLLTASGVGPKLAQAMLAVLSPDDLRRAVTAEDIKALTRVPGIGQKGAQRIVLELKDRIGSPTGSSRPRATGAAAVASAAGGWRDQVHAGLVGLGWSAKEAEKAVDAVAPEADRQAGEDVAPDVAALLRAALRSLSKA
jgi:Holliday junction DNA helicase RuvA